jgi:two-component system response regulator
MARAVRVMIVEDNSDDGRCGLLEDLLVVRDGREAIDTLAESVNGASEKPPDLILLDLHLPKVSGLEVLQWIRADQRLKEVPVVVLTGIREDRSLVELHRLGVRGYWVKPLTSQDLVRIIVEGAALSPS